MTAVRNRLYQPNPPVLNTLPVRIFGGEMTLTREQGAVPSAIARSMYFCGADHFSFFVCLKSHGPAASTYYWLIGFQDEGACARGHWTDTSSAEENLAWAREKVRELRPDLAAVIQWQTAERMFKPFSVWDREPEACPAGPVTLLGDAMHCMSPCESTASHDCLA